MIDLGHCCTCTEWSCPCGLLLQAFCDHRARGGGCAVDRVAGGERLGVREHVHADGGAPLADARTCASSLSLCYNFKACARSCPACIHFGLQNAAIYKLLSRIRAAEQLASRLL